MAEADNVHSVSSGRSKGSKGFSGARLKSGLLALAFLSVAILGGIGGGYLQSQSQDNNVIGGNLSNEKRIVSSQSRLINQIAKSAGASVVSITVDTEVSGITGELQPGAAGTGIILSKDGIVVTNRHVIPEGTDTVSVTLSDGTELDNVSVIGRTASTDSLDIAFLKINETDGKTLVPAKLGDSAAVEVGDDVVAIGNALGEFQNSVTAGIISGFGRNVQAGRGADTESLSNLIQTDAAINEGNSGGPLVNLNGQVIGINTAIAGGDAQNIGFAIPINDVKGLIAQVLETGKFERPFMGVRYVLLDAQVAEEYELERTTGAYIAPSMGEGESSVIPGSPADKAGLQEGDIITKVGNTSIDEKNNLVSLLAQRKPGDKVELTIIRDGKTQTKSVTLGTAPR